MKRAFDVLMALLLLLLFAPLLLLTAVAVALFLGQPVLFRQQRPGLKGRPFTLVKFRTMLDANDAAGNPLPDSKRLTRFGRFLRASSLDELPELWNVLRGEMSLVGPRPLLMDYLNLYSKRQARRHDARPVITGWAQVNGRNAISWEDKFEMDVWYVENQNFWLDIKILFMTAYKVVKRDGISAAGQATQSKFTGSESEV